MEQVILNGVIFITGIIFGAGSFYGLVITKLNNQNSFNHRVEEQFKNIEGQIKILSDKIDDIKDDILNLTERISKIEGKINGQFFK